MFIKFSLWNLGVPTYLTKRNIITICGVHNMYYIIIYNVRFWHEIVNNLIVITNFDLI